MRWRRILVIVIGLLVVLPIGGIGIFHCQLQSERLEAAHSECGDERQRARTVAGTGQSR